MITYSCSLSLGRDREREKERKRASVVNVQPNIQFYFVHLHIDVQEKKKRDDIRHIQMMIVNGIIVSCTNGYSFNLSKSVYYFDQSRCSPKNF